jgi:gluconokinase
MGSSNRKIWYLGIDLGTGSCKSVIIDAQARILGFSASAYSSSSSDTLWNEQDPDALIVAMVQSARDAIRDAIEREGISPTACGAVSLSGAYHSIMTVNTAGEPLTGVITWVDGRAAPQAEAVRRALDPQEIYQQTGCPIHAMYPLYKLIWLREELPQVFDQAARFISGKEYVLTKLTGGEYLVDIGIAAGTGLLNTHTLNWNPLSLELAGITPDRLSSLCSSTQIIRKLDPVMAKQLGIPEDVPLVVGSADAVNSSLGAGAVMSGQATCMVGTSGAFRIIADKPVLDQQARTWCYAIDHGYWLVGGAINNGGLALSWFREILNQMLRDHCGNTQLTFE